MHWTKIPIFLMNCIYTQQLRCKLRSHNLNHILFYLYCLPYNSYFAFTFKELAFFLRKKHILHAKRQVKIKNLL